MEKELVLAVVSGLIWLLHVSSLIVLWGTTSEGGRRRRKLARTLALATMATTFCFALYLVLTLP